MDPDQLAERLKTAVIVIEQCHFTNDQAGLNSIIKGGPIGKVRLVLRGCIVSASGLAFQQHENGDVDVVFNNCVIMDKESHGSAA